MGQMTLTWRGSPRVAHTRVAHTRVAHIRVAHARVAHAHQLAHHTCWPRRTCPGQM